jgi:hypothetical protein
VECVLLLAATGRESADAATVWQHAAENYDAAGASGIGVPRARQTLAAWSRDGDVSAESTGNTISGGCMLQDAPLGVGLAFEPTTEQTG